MSTRIHFSDIKDDHIDVTVPPEQIEGVLNAGQSLPVRLDGKDGPIWINPGRVAYWTEAPKPRSKSASFL